MRTLLFCQNPYAFGILGPLAAELSREGHDILWYIPEEISNNFPFNGEYNTSSSIRDCYNFKSDAIFVPGNEVPHYLRGIKVQIFHGFAGEKKGHFRIRHYFDLYLTQGPWFTEKFKDLASRFGNFEVAETGWSKLDPLFHNDTEESLRTKILKNTGAEKLVLYAPTFSPSLTSAAKSIEYIVKLSKNKRLHIVVKFHDLTSQSIMDSYTAESIKHKNLFVSSDKNILPLLKAADLMISDTSSAVYEFLLLDKPVVTIQSRSKHINWDNISDISDLESAVMQNLSTDPYMEARTWFFENYHPYSDGKSSLRMIKEVERIVKQKGVPERRKLSLLRRNKINKLFGKENDHVR